MTCIAPDRIAAPRIVVGVGCRAGKSPEAIEAAIAAALARRPGLALADIVRVATLDAKAAEPGLVACCARHGWPLVAIVREAIAPDAPPGDGTAPSSAAFARFGVEGVCEPCALAAAPHGRLLVPKTIVDGVTVAIAGPA
ncbi:cobalamin biosynthesis protein [Burkholderia gladioli]|uniref:cobalamin biosynthesis protein n=1 Tax=Burkholderia gladioli TaxID=28095 RepID=UPI00163FD84D|nr:cobalamin biosynthesis protein [Burkholderia gladioli]MDN7717756.1 cobalamin biosynthesis protein [Burkholderia gladioli]